MQLEKLKVTEEPVRVRIDSEPFVVFTPFGYAGAVEAYLPKKKHSRLLMLSASSLAKAIEEMRQKNGGKFVGIEFWVNKKNSDKRAPYEVEEIL
jgi:hypothetical protein